MSKSKTTNSSLAASGAASKTTVPASARTPAAAVGQPTRKRSSSSGGGAVKEGKRKKKKKKKHKTPLDKKEPDVTEEAEEEEEEGESDVAQQDDGRQEMPSDSANEEWKKEREQDDNDGNEQARARRIAGNSDHDEEEDPSPPNAFSSLQPPLHADLLACIHRDFGFRSMTPVQSAVIPLFLTHRDVCVQAVTGSGKTLAFCLPVISKMLEKIRSGSLTKKQVTALVVSPTRELARQTHQVASILLKACRLPPPLLVVGGNPVAADLQRFLETQSKLVIGTPGRTQDLLTRYDVMDMSELDWLVLDEADVLLEMGFELSLQAILARLPKMRRTGLFSATSVPALMKKAGMRNPAIVHVAVAGKTRNDESAEKATAATEQATPLSLTNYHVLCPLQDKLNHLVAFLRQHSDQKMIVFCLTCAVVEFLSLVLPPLLGDSAEGTKLEALHGKLVQKRREAVMERFRSGETTVLLCTDVAARGLDVSDVQWTVQLDAPTDPQQYVHRVGRSARAGRTGYSLLFLTPKEEAYVDFLQLRKVPLQEWTPAPTTDVLKRIRQMVLTDRNVLEKGTQAFTSYIRAYKEHYCSFIFRFASLDLGALATLFCLLRLPKMPELRNVHQTLNFTSAGPEVDISAIAYRDATREAARQARLRAERAAGGKSAKQLRAEQRAAQRAQRVKERKEALQSKGINTSKPKSKRGRQSQMYEEWDELAKEERLYKKLRKRQITPQQYRQLMASESTTLEEEMVGDGVEDVEQETQGAES